MTGDANSSDLTPEIYWRPGCPYCSSLRRQPKRWGVVASWRNIWEDEKAAEFVRSVNAGNETVPTVRVGAQTLTNPTGAQVAQLARRAAAVAFGQRLANGRRRPPVGQVAEWQAMRAAHRMDVANGSRARRSVAGGPSPEGTASGILLTSG